MKFNVKIIKLALVVGLGFAPRLSAIDPDGTVYNDILALGFGPAPAAGSPVTPITTASIPTFTGASDPNIAAYTTLLTNAQALYTLDGTNPPTSTTTGSSTPSVPLLTYYNNLGVMLNAVKAQAAALGSTTPAPAPTAVAADATVLAAITTAMSKYYSVAQSKWTASPPSNTMSSAIAGLNKLAITYAPKGSSNNATVAGTTINVFAAALMNAGGNWAATINAYAAKKTYTAADKAAIKKLIAAIKVYGGASVMKSLDTMMGNAANSNLLTSAQKTYVTKTLMSNLINNYNKLTKVK